MLAEPHASLGIRILWTVPLWPELLLAGHQYHPYFVLCLQFTGKILVYEDLTLVWKVDYKGYVGC